VGWVEIRNVSKMYRRRGTSWFAKIEEMDDDDDDDEVGESPERKEDTHPTGQKEIWALRDINLRINAGDAVAVVGLGGSGKTTLVSILGGITLPTTGEVRGKGAVLPLNFLRTPFFGDATGRQNLAMLESLLGMAKGRILDRAQEIASFAGMERQLDQKVGQYSTSMYAKLALAAGLFCDPGILLVDDGISGGDPPFRARVAAKLKEVVNQGATLIYATQTVSDLASLCRRVVWLSDGRIIADESANALLPKYEAVCGWQKEDQSSREGEKEELTKEDIQEDNQLGAIHISRDTFGQAPPSERKFRLVLQSAWHRKVNNLEKRLQRFVERCRTNSAELTREPATFFRAELGTLARLSDVRVVHSGSRPVFLTNANEPVQVEIEVEVLEPNIEIGLRVELDAMGTLLFASDLPWPFCAKSPGRYVLLFSLQEWLTRQQIDTVVDYKIVARTFFRKPANGWEDMDVGTAHICDSGKERVLLTAVANGASLTERIPTWLEEVTPKPSDAERTPLLRPRLDWQIHRIEEVAGEESQLSAGSDAREELQEQIV
jgi:ABC-type polysaccharide/polyol phosphate transport system ATPase subunit